VPLGMLPEVRPSAGVFGETAALEGIPGGIPVAGMAGDQQAALYAQQCWEPGQAKNTYGTGSFVLMNMGNRHPVSQHGLLTTLCCDAQGGPAYALEGALFTTGATVQWLRDGLGIIADAGETEALAASLPDNEGVYLVPAFAGLGAPYWDMEARGALMGLTRGSGRAHVARAALESMAYQTRDVVTAMNADAGLPLSVLRVDGGAAANNFLMQFQADMLDTSIGISKIEEASALGAALMGGLTTGLWKDVAELKSLRGESNQVTSRMHEAQRSALYNGWKKAVNRTTIYT